MPDPSTGSENPGVPFRDALRFWLELGFISFGGPAGQIAIMHQELVERRHWVSDRRFLHALNFCMVLPGPEAQQLATYLGWLMHRTWGGIVAGSLFILPSLVILIALSWVYVVHGDKPLLEGVFYGIKPAVTAIVLHAAWRIGSRTLKNPWTWSIAVAAFVAIFALSAPFPLIILGAALIGWLASRIDPAAFSNKPGHATGIATGPAAGGVAVIGDDSPLPDHARFTPSRLLTVMVCGLLLWAGPLLALALTLGPDHALTQMGWFFTKAALLTFGGAYAVLPYVYQGAVETFGWISATQMVDGLALGETTPGPLIMVVTFVGYVGGHTGQVLATMSPWLGGVAAALVVTWFTFLPSFIFILAGAPLIETSRNIVLLTAPLTAITAAVVGVIVNLAIWFGRHVLFLGSALSSPDWIAIGIAGAAAVALFRFNRGVLEVIGASALAGAALSAF